MSATMQLPAWTVQRSALAEVFRRFGLSMAERERLFKALKYASIMDQQFDQAADLRHCEAACRTIRRRATAVKIQRSRKAPLPPSASVLETALRARRVHLGDIACRAGISKSYVCMLIRGQRANPAALSRVQTAFVDLLQASSSKL